MDIEEIIKDWNGRSVGNMEEVYETFREDPAFISTLIGCLKDPSYHVGATWLLKHHFLAGHVLTPSEISKIYRPAIRMEHWMSKLLILQSMPYMPIRKVDVRYVEPFVRACLKDENRMVRAWAYNGFFELAVQHPTYQKEARELLTAAKDDEAGSVRARIRNIMRTGFWDDM